MTAMAEGGLGSNLSCSVCTEEYKKVTPKVLPCGHTYCCTCLSKIVNFYRGASYLLCPTCRGEIGLPQSGKVEDFPTNFALIDLSSDQALSQTRIKTEQPTSEKGGPDRIDCYCPQHGILMKFYCNTCRMQVCADCLLGEHETGQHCIVPASKVAASLSNELQKLNAKLQYHDQDKAALDDKISEAMLLCQQDKQKLENEIHATVQRETHRLQEAGREMLDAIAKRAESQKRTCADLQQRYSNLNNLYNQIQGNCSTLNQDFQQHNLSHEFELERIDKNIESLKDHIDSLKTTCQSTPKSVGLCITTAQSPLGITLGEFKIKPMILQAAEFTNATNSNSGNTTGGYFEGSIPNTLCPPQFVPRGQPMSYQPQPYISN